ncbi:oligopeptide transporter, OPT family [Ameyamaea chiangmaiensis]|uniref:Oligopeptide transporter, OPT family n=2 Tax=Ameyamaea chiangmaiensis TaxID=442969 RepID=A0A850PEL8_9PROT|nr:oligopeptide transporter, OPT family [Ameyamaea chiangmaiensis]NVN40706.1 oligopeptide transporter, OPT family [Ameyamaea chiangmaiensis]
MSSPSARPRELTLRGIILGALITIVFTASNVYLGLKIGLTFASSIPAAVISMAVLKALGGDSILENNMVQTQASAAGTLSCVFAAFPALVIVGWWSHFPFLETAGLTLAGGITGVIFTVPLRRALVTNSALPYPEGVAAAEILRSASAEGTSGGVRALASGGAIAATVTFLTSGLRVLSDQAAVTLTAGTAIFRPMTGFSLALFGAGYLVGIGGGIAMLLGVFIAWGVSVPWLTAAMPLPHPAGATALAEGVWLHKVRFLGAGTIAVAAVWTLFSLLGPVARGVREMLAPTASAPDHERDLSPRALGVLGVGMAVFLAVLFAHFLAPSPGGMGLLVVTATLFCLVFGFLIAGACGYMAGIVGSSSSPISGIGIVTMVALCALLMGMERWGLVPASLLADGHRGVIAFALFVLSALVASAAISNDNLQDLKTGQLVGASPRLQEIALLIGCIAGAAVIPPVFNLLYQAYGFVGALPRPGMDPSAALAAPQPALMATIAQGIFLHTLDWTMIAVGAALGVALIVIDIVLRRRALALPPLAVGMGIYLPATVSVTLAIGAFVGWLLARRARPKGHSDVATMIASGMIVGESLMGVAIAGVAGVTGRDDALALVGPGFMPISTLLAALVFVATVVWFSRQVLRTRLRTG